MHELIKPLPPHVLLLTGQKNEQGVFLIYFSLLLVTLLTIGSFSVDLGFGYSEMRRIHIATDNAAIAAMHELVERGAAPDDQIKKNGVLNVANVIAQANGILPSEFSSGPDTGIELGRWNPAQQVFTAEPNIANVDAIRISARRTLPTMLAVLFGHETIFPTVASVAFVGNPTSDVCLVPYGILDDLIVNANPGDTFTIDRDTTSAGNWGKLNVDPNGNMSTRVEFIPAFLSGHCNIVVRTGQFVPSAPGFSGLEDAVNQRQLVNPIVKMLVVEDFFDGKKPVKIVGFVTVKIVAQRGRGRNWEADLVFLNKASGDGSSGPGGGVLNKSVVLVR